MSESAPQSRPLSREYGFPVRLAGAAVAGSIALFGCSEQKDWKPVHEGEGIQVSAGANESVHEMTSDEMARLNDGALDVASDGIRAARRSEILQKPLAPRKLVGLVDPQCADERCEQVASAAPHSLVLGAGTPQSATVTETRYPDLPKTFYHVDIDNPNGSSRDFFITTPATRTHDQLTYDIMNDVLEDPEAKVYRFVYDKGRAQYRTVENEDGVTELQFRENNNTVIQVDAWGDWGISAKTGVADHDLLYDPGMPDQSEVTRYAEIALGRRLN